MLTANLCIFLINAMKELTIWFEYIIAADKIFVEYFIKT